MKVRPSKAGVALGRRGIHLAPTLTGVRRGRRHSGRSTRNDGRRDIFRNTPRGTDAQTNRARGMLPKCGVEEEQRIWDMECAHCSWYKFWDMEGAVDMVAHTGDRYGGAHFSHGKLKHVHLIKKNDTTHDLRDLYSVDITMLPRQIRLAANSRSVFQSCVPCILPATLCYRA